MRGGSLTDSCLLLSLIVASGCQSPWINREALKAEIRHEILAELEAERRVAKEPATDPNQSPEHDGKPRALSPDPVPATPRRATGRVRGRLVRGGIGVPECPVRLARLEADPGLLGLFSKRGETALIDTITDGDGEFLLEGVPAGPYRLKWRPPGDTGWLRRLRDRPDLIVEEGSTSDAGDIPLRRPVVVTLRSRDPAASH